MFDDLIFLFIPSSLLLVQYSTFISDQNEKKKTIYVFNVTH